jgi:aspartyl-tRNA(Asn)/glutamyl-tRNA(Gln) amidotransferase subunit C
MADITPADVEYVAGLAQLVLDDKVKDRMVRDLADILSYIDKLNELNTDGIEPMMHAMDMRNVFRDDVPGHSLTREQALANAPAHDGEYFLVPQILEGE